MIAYEKHPVSPERKSELIAKGYKIIDERFKPADAVEVVEEKPRRRKSKKGEPQSSE